ncbi:hypothetical protein NPIL_72541 [Nephila pilipes]|uniref:Uncharacterized protein n=1 Tax=Nephila pilipes TaxID=299642 RepID=A0A8X6PTR6_NEPPI|nr:hypothetical protein NPIL_72541 [Nephila pilipes]
MQQLTRKSPDMSSLVITAMFKNKLVMETDSTSVSEIEDRISRAPLQTFLECVLMRGSHHKYTWSPLLMVNQENITLTEVYSSYSSNGGQLGACVAVAFRIDCPLMEEIKKNLTFRVRNTVAIAFPVEDGIFLNSEMVCFTSLKCSWVLG